MPQIRAADGKYATSKSVWMEVVGVPELQEAMRAQERAMAAAWSMALKAGALLIQRDSVKRTPLEFGTLRKSCGTRAMGAGWETEVMVFYTASYAIYVHEILSNNHPIGEAEFLKKAVVTQANAVQELVKQIMEKHGYKPT